MNWGLSESVITSIRGIFACFPLVTKAVIYGSRAKGNYKHGSDIDLTLFGAGLTMQDCATIAKALDDLLLPYCIDLSVYDNLILADIREHIDSVGQVFYEADANVQNLIHTSEG